MKSVIFLIFFSSFTFGLIGRDLQSPHSQENKINTLLTSLHQQVLTNHSGFHKKSFIRKQLLTENQIKIPVNTSNSNKNIIQASEKNSKSKDKPNQTLIKEDNTNNTLNQDKKITLPTLNKATSKTSIDKGKKPSFLFQLNNEVRLSQNLISRSQKKPFAGIPYTALSLNSSLLPLDFFMELEFFPQDQQKFNASEISLSYSLKIWPITLQTGMAASSSWIWA